MNKYLIFALINFFAVGCAGTVTKDFTVIVDPPDSVIKISSGVTLKEKRYSSPATIRIEIPKDPALASKVVLEVSKIKYEPTSIAVGYINNGETIRIKLKEIKGYEVRCRLIEPIRSDEVKFQDKALSIKFAVHEQAFQITVANLSIYPLKILWGKVEYTDIQGKQLRLMYSGIPYQNRNGTIPDQVVLPGKSLQEDITPIEHIYMSPQTKNYEVKPLFNHKNYDSAGLNGKVINLFFPIEVNRAIIPYEFKLEIVGIVNGTGKD
ncbi:MAG TPA: hypothetical protein VLX29_00300 [Nitrospirota bacterium]|nr:hypothetical protein [Nitrospirota bacterium]